jgi:hypothetical protein
LLHQADALERAGGVRSPSDAAGRAVTHGASVSSSSKLTVTATVLAGPVSSSEEDVTEKGTEELGSSEKRSSDRLTGDYVGVILLDHDQFIDANGLEADEVKTRTYESLTQALDEADPGLESCNKQLLQSILQ